MKILLLEIFFFIYFSTSCVCGTLNDPNCGKWIEHKDDQIDGQVSEPNQYPWLALLQYKTDRGDQYGCSGVLINDRYVLTTARCLTDPKRKLTHVHLGEWDLASTRPCFVNPKYSNCSSIIVTGIEQKIPHEKFGSDDPSKSYDIGLIKLDRSVGDWSRICLPNKPPLRNSFSTAGWGSDITFEYTRHVIKRQTKNLKSFDKGKCAAELDMQILQDDLYCVQAEYVELACIGDSGGPLMTINADRSLMVAGMLHSTNQICRERLNKPIVYTNVSQYMDWIEENMQMLPEAPSVEHGDTSESPIPAPEELKVPYQFPGCGLPIPRRDFDSNVTDIGDYPWLALLEYDTPENGKQLLCGGVLISDQHILTAAHCVTSRSNKLTSVILGEYDTNAILECVYQGPNHSPICVDSMRKFDVEQVFVHDNYNDGISHRDPLNDDLGPAPHDDIESSLHDIALLKLKTKVQFTSYVKPICLPTKKPINRFHVAGWGRFSVPGNKGLNLKLTSYLNTCTKSESDRREIESIFDEKEHICAATRNQYNYNPCIADSGGPLMAEEKKEDGNVSLTVYGVSYMETSCHDYLGKPKNLPGIFTNVYNYKDWIIKYMNV